jgi:thiol-disulfide isomerase/thioredoxin
MVHLKGLIAALVLAALMWTGWAYYKDFLQQGQKPPDSTLKLNDLNESLPDFELVDLKGESVSLAKFKDHVIILNFWASWCDPCVEEFPSLLSLLDEFKGKVKLLAISADTELDDMNNFLKAFKANSPHLVVMWDKNQEVAKKFGTSVLPESYILGYNNKFYKKVAGVEDWSKPYVREYFKSLVDENPTK